MSNRVIVRVNRDYVDALEKLSFMKDVVDLIITYSNRYKVSAFIATTIVSVLCCANKNMCYLHLSGALERKRYAKPRKCIEYADKFSTFPRGSICGYLS